MSSSPHPLSHPLSPPPSLPPEVLRFLLWLEKTEGRDKLYRLVVYFSKWLVHTLKQTPSANPDYIKRIAAGASVVATSRKLLRLFRSLEFLQDALDSLAVADSVERLAAFIKGISLAMWLFFDHIQWLQKAGYLRLSSSTVNRIDIYHSQSWFSGLLFGALLSLYKLQLLVKEERLLMASMHPLPSGDVLKRNDVEDVRKKALLKLQEKKAKQVLGVIKNGTDLIIPAARLRWVGVSDGTVGLAGTLTSLMGIWSTYPTTLKH